MQNKEAQANPAILERDEEIFSRLRSNPKALHVALRHTRGVGESSAKALLKNLNINLSSGISGISGNEVADLVEGLGFITQEVELQTAIFADTAKLKSLECFRGTRAQQGLPQRGQRTKTNAQTTRRLFSASIGSKFRLKKKRRKIDAAKKRKNSAKRENKAKKAK